VCAEERVVGTIVVRRQPPASPLLDDERLFVDEVARRLACAYL
jgi:hypothetical protein